jgi:hypothetical protein
VAQGRNAMGGEVSTRKVFGGEGIHALTKKLSWLALNI